jgi:hypothetical protein
MAGSVGEGPAEPQDIIPCIMLQATRNDLRFCAAYARGIHSILWYLELIHDNFFPASGCGNLIALVEHGVGEGVCYCIRRKGITPVNIPKLLLSEV